MVARDCNPLLKNSGVVGCIGGKYLRAYSRGFALVENESPDSRYISAMEARPLFIVINSGRQPILFWKTHRRSLDAWVASSSYFPVLRKGPTEEKQVSSNSKSSPVM